MSYNQVNVLPATGLWQVPVSGVVTISTDWINNTALLPTNGLDHCLTVWDKGSYASG